MQGLLAGMTPLDYAFKNPSWRVIHELLAHGADWSDSLAPLHTPKKHQHQAILKHQPQQYSAQTQPTHLHFCAKG